MGCPCLESPEEQVGLGWVSTVSFGEAELIHLSRGHGERGNPFSTVVLHS